ncbi:MAG: type VI secretion system tube protein Hcp [Gemmatimonadetes bacterium]|nr:type VI secretion system tube protein Hcp [Gemmatimonadota bacterium]
MKTSATVAIPLALATAGAADVVAADDIFLDLRPEIEGDSVDPQYAQTVEVLAWSWNLSRDVFQQSGQPPSLGAVIARDIKISKYVDGATVDLADRLIKGAKIDEATLIVRDNAEPPVSYIKIKMSSVYVTKIAEGAEEGFQNRSSETIGLNFGNVCITYTTGAQGGSSEEECWDIGGSKL